MWNARIGVYCYNVRGIRGYEKKQRKGRQTKRDRKRADGKSKRESGRLRKTADDRARERERERE